MHDWFGYWKPHSDSRSTYAFLSKQKQWLQALLEKFYRKEFEQLPNRMCFSRAQSILSAEKYFGK